MPDQDGLRFLFDITDKITAKLAKIEAKSKASAEKIDRAFTRASKSQETNSLKLAALEQRRVLAAQSNATKLLAIGQRHTASSQANATKLTAIEQRRRADMQKSAERAEALAKRESAARAQSSAKSVAAEKRRIAAVDKAHAKSEALLKRQSGAFKKSMGRMAASAAVAFAAIAGKALSMASGYDAAMRSVQAKTGATGAVLEKLSEQAREMGRTTVHSATEAARGQAFLAQAGFDANEILGALPGTLALATAGELDLASAADIASNVLSGFRLETEHTGRVTDVLAAIAARTNTSVSQMGVALAKAAPSAAAAGWSLEQTAAAIGRLSDAGIQGEEAGTVLKTMLARLAAPTGKLGKLMTATGISVKDTTGKMLPLNDIIAQLAPHADNTGLMFELLGTRGANAGLILGSLGADDLNGLTTELENAEGAATEMAGIMGGGLWGAIKSIQSIVESAYISLGQRFGPSVEKLAKLFKKLPAPIQEVVVVVGSLAVAMGGLAVMMPQAFGSLTNLPGKLLGVTKAFRALNLTMLANPIGLVIAAVALLAGGLYLLFTKTEVGRQAFEAISHVVKVAFAAAINFARLTIVALVWWFKKLKPLVLALIPPWVIKAVRLLGDAIGFLTRKLRDFNDHMDKNAKQARITGEALEELGDVTALDDLSETAKRLGKEGRLSAEVMKEIAKRAITLQGEGGKLDKKLQGIVRVFGEVVKKGKPTTRAIQAAGEAAEDTADEVGKLIDAWTGATLKSGEFLKAFSKLTPAQKENDRIMGQVLDTYSSMRKVLGPFNDELEAQWRITERLNPEIAAQRKETEKLKKAAEELGEKGAQGTQRRDRKAKEVNGGTESGGWRLSAAAYWVFRPMRRLNPSRS